MKTEQEREIELNRFARVQDWPDKPIPRHIVENGVAKVNPAWEAAEFSEVVIWQDLRPVKRAASAQTGATPQMHGQERPSDKPSA